MKANLSVIIPYFNNENTIQRCLDSIFNQSLLPTEIIIINDGSKAIFEEEIKNPKNINIKIFNNKKNQGASYARNFGIKKSTSNYIAFLDADDVWLPEKIFIQYDYMLKSNCEISCHGYISTYSRKYIKKNIESDITIKSIKLKNFILGNKIHTPTVMALKESFVHFDTRLKRMEDYKCWVENCLDKEIHKIDITLAHGFKPPLGHSGLSESIFQMHKDFLKAINILYQENKISATQYYLTFIFEKIKYPIRYLLWNSRRQMY